MSAAEGWLELGNWNEANNELENVTPAHRAHAKVLVLRWRILVTAKRWEQAVDIARLFTKHAPDRAVSWLRLSYTLHEAGRTQEAFDNLIGAAEKFPRVWKIPYHMARCCAHLGKLKEAERWFTRAMSIDASAVRSVALDDPELRRLWDSFGGTLCA